MAVPQSKMYDKLDIFSFSIPFSNLPKNLSAVKIIDDLDLPITLCKYKKSRQPVHFHNVLPQIVPNGWCFLLSTIARDMTWWYLTVLPDSAVHHLDEVDSTPETAPETVQPFSVPGPQYFQTLTNIFGLSKKFYRMEFPGHSSNESLMLRNLWRQPSYLHIPIWIHLSLETGTGIQGFEDFNLILRLLSTLSAAQNSGQKKSGIPIGQGSMQRLLQIRRSLETTWTQIWSG